MSGFDPVSRPDSEQWTSFLDRSMRWWNLAFLLIFVVVGVITVLEGLPTGDMVLALVALATVVAGHLAIGRRKLLEDKRVSAPVTIGYLLMLYVLTLLISSLSSIGNMLFFVAFTSTWMLLPVSWAIGASVLFIIGIVFTNVAAANWSPAAWGSGLAFGGAIATVGILFGLWVNGVVDESERRKGLIAELETTRSELGEAQHRAGAFAERERLAGEIHDTIAQGLLSIVVHSRAIDTNDPELEQRIRRIEQIAQQNLVDARGLIEVLQPADLAEHSLPDACGRVSARFGTDTGIPVRFRTEGESRTLPANTEVVLLRAAQEALTNVHKHAGANAVDMVLAYRADPSSTADPDDEVPGTVRLRVTDDGVGFLVPDPETESWGSSGHRAGLRGMRNRAEQIGGRVEVNSSPGAGTTISVEVPW